MGHIDNRAERRKKSCMQAFASDANDSFEIKCIIRDVSPGGCMIVSSHLHELPDRIQLVPEGFKEPLLGQIVWRKGKTAGVSFIETSLNPDLDEMHQRLDSPDAVEDDDDVLTLEAFAKPAGYSDRLSRYKPQAK